MIVSDIRRKTDIKYFKEEGYYIKTIRIEANDEVRKARGWVFEDGIDNVQSECDLDNFEQWDFKVDNNNDHNNVDTTFLSTLYDVIQDRIHE